MGFFSRLVPGAKLLGRRESAKQGQSGEVNWPRCAQCCRIVDAYGVENETDAALEIWARCSGTLIDPKTGVAVWGAARRHAPLKASVLIHKGPGWSRARLTDIITRIAFFSQDGDRMWAQNLTAKGVRPS